MAPQFPPFFVRSVICANNGDEVVTDRWRKLRNEELRNFTLDVTLLR
jgi:hypothetical protein